MFLVGSVTVPGVSEGHVGYEEGRHWPDSEHFPDGGLKIWQVALVAKFGVSVHPNFTVHLLLNLLLHLMISSDPALQLNAP